MENVAPRNLAIHFIGKNHIHATAFFLPENIYIMINTILHCWRSAGVLEYVGKGMSCSPSGKTTTREGSEDIMGRMKDLLISLYDKFMENINLEYVPPDEHEDIRQELERAGVYTTPVERPMEIPLERLMERPVERQMERPVERFVERPAADVHYRTATPPRPPADERMSVEERFARLSRVNSREYEYRPTLPPEPITRSRDRQSRQYFDDKVMENLLNLNERVDRIREVIERHDRLISRMEDIEDIGKNLPELQGGLIKWLGAIKKTVDHHDANINALSLAHSQAAKSEDFAELDTRVQELERLKDTETEPWRVKNAIQDIELLKSVVSGHERLLERVDSIEDLRTSIYEQENMIYQLRDQLSKQPVGGGESKKISIVLRELSRIRAALDEHERVIATVKQLDSIIMEYANVPARMRSMLEELKRIEGDIGGIQGDTDAQKTNLDQLKDQIKLLDLILEEHEEALRKATDMDLIRVDVEKLESMRQSIKEGAEKELEEE